MTQLNKQLAGATKRRCCRALDQNLDPGLFKALGDPNRLAILVRLAGFGEPATVSQIACCYPLDISVVSRHLRALRDAGVLDAEKRGKEVFYTVKYEALSARLRAIADAIDACCPPASCQ